MYKDRASFPQFWKLICLASDEDLRIHAVTVT